MKEIRPVPGNHEYDTDGAAPYYAYFTQVVVGTGGADLRGFRTPSANSVSRVEGHWGVLKLTLGAGACQHAFLDISGRIWDPGKGACH